MANDFEYYVSWLVLPLAGRQTATALQYLLFHSHTIISTYFDVLFGVLQVLKQRVFRPGDPALLVGRRVRVAVGLSGLTTEKTVQIGSLLVRAALLDSVALRALGLEDLGSLLFTHLDVYAVASLACFNWIGLW